MTTSSSQPPATTPQAEAPDRPKGRKRVKTPTVLQMEAVECGAAALGSILGHYGRIVPLEELRATCGVSRDGSTAINVVRAARTYGLTAAGYRMEPQKVLESRLPAIIFWNFNHFVVVEGYDAKWVYLNDPASGPRRVTHEDFDKSFTGVVLTFEPGPEFKRGGSRPSLVRTLGQNLQGSHGALLYCILVGLALVIPGLAIPVFSKIFVDVYLVSGRSEIIVPLLLGMALTAVLRAGLTWLQQLYLLRLNTKLSVTMSSRFLWHVLRLPLEFYSQRYGGEISFRVGLNDTVAGLLSGQLATAVLNLVTVVFYAALMFAYDWPLTLIGIGFAALNILGLRYVSRRRVDLNQRYLQEQGKLMGTSMSGLQTIETLKASGAESDFFARWAGAEAKTVNAQQELGVPSQFLTSLPTLLAALNTAAILAFGGLRVMSGELTIGTLVAFQSLMTSFTMPINQLVSLGTQLQDAEGNINRISDVLVYPTDPTVAREEAASMTPDLPATLSGRLELRDVSFGYSPLAPPLIEGFNLTIEPGQRVALVGASGSGKSTISRLVSGLYRPWSGEILLDGKPREELPRALLANSLALVDQDIFLFEGTVTENITLWDETIPEAQVVQAAKDAAIHDDIAARDGGYESQILEAGRNFSGGQRQRIEIARALVLNPSLLVLDEATASLDPITEVEIDQHLRRRGCTCLLVAHRLSTIRDCDQIIVLDGGKITQRGTHDELKDVEGPYADLIRS